MQGLSIRNPVMDELVAVANDILDLKKRHTIVVAEFSALLRKANSSATTTGPQPPEVTTPNRPKPRGRKAVKPKAAGPKAIEAEVSKPKAPKARPPKRRTPKREEPQPNVTQSELPQPEALKPEPSPPTTTKVELPKVETPRDGSESQAVVTLLQKFDANVSTTLKSLGISQDHPDYKTQKANAMLVSSDRPGWKAERKALPEDERRHLQKLIAKEIEQLTGKTFVDAAEEYRRSKKEQ